MERSTYLIREWLFRVWCRFRNVKVEIAANGGRSDGLANFTEVLIKCAFVHLDG